MKCPKWHICQPFTETLAQLHGHVKWLEQPLPRPFVLSHVSEALGSALFRWECTQSQTIFITLLERMASIMEPHCRQTHKKCQLKNVQITVPGTNYKSSNECINGEVEIGQPLQTTNDATHRHKNAASSVDHRCHTNRTYNMVTIIIKIAIKHTLYVCIS